MTPIIFSLIVVFTRIPGSECSSKCGYSASALARKRVIGRNYEHSDEDDINQVPKADRHKEVMLFAIVGGSEAGLGEFPWMVSLQVHQGGKFWQHICGGSLLAPDWILTAGHCRFQMEGHSVRAVAGCHRWRTNGEFDCQVSEFDVLADMINHEEFHLSTFNNDISLIHLKKPFRSSMQRPVTNICIPPEDSVYSGMATVAGWGNLSYKGRIAESLMMVQVRILRPSDCAGYPNFRPGPQLCAGFVEGEKDACSVCLTSSLLPLITPFQQGDSGGPLMMSIGPHTYQIAIVSSGRDCAKTGYPGIYTNVASYRSWIQSKSGLQLN